MQLSSPGHDRSGLDLTAAVRHISKASAIAAIVLSLLIVFEIDRVTGSAPFQHLYYVGIILAGLRFGMPGGVLASVASVVLYHLANPRLLTLRYESGDIVQIALFIAVGLISAKIAGDARRLHDLAMTDDLTGLHNLRSYEQRLTGLLLAAHGSTLPIAVFVLDVDRLKSLNDRYGHLTGAGAVQTVGRVIHRHVGRDGVACRYGGDEFAIALPRCSKQQAIAWGDQLRQAVQACPPVLAGRAFPAGTLSVSIGVACREADRGAAKRLSAADAHSVSEQLFRDADGALYGAKTRGRNSTCAAWEARDGYDGGDLALSRGAAHGAR